jgi:hypothetical protein
MTHEDVNRTLRYMEHLREAADEAESAAEARRLDREYGALWRSVEPFVMGTEPFADDAPPVPST